MGFTKLSLLLTIFCQLLYSEPIEYIAYLQEPNCHQSPCSLKDIFKLENDTSLARGKIIELLEKKEISNISLAFFSISDHLIAQKICEVSSKKNIKLYVDFSQKAKLEKEIKPCRSNLSIKYFGHKNDIKLFHMKFILAEPSDSDYAQIFFSSANLSSGLYKHFENWNYLKVSKSSYLHQKHKCVLHALDNFQKGTSEYALIFDDCLKQIRYQDEKVKLYSLPREGKELSSKILSLLKGNSSCLISAHHFSYKVIYDQLLKNPNHVIITDKSHLDINIKGEFRTHYYESLLLKKLKSKGVKVLYANNNPSLKQLYHNKIILCNSEMILGSANFTRVGMINTRFRSSPFKTTIFSDNLGKQSANLENMYSVKDLEVIEFYKRRLGLPK